MTQDSLIGISEACQLLGVSENSLRQWTDEGSIKAFVTPGGHRRYLVSDLKKFLGSRHRTVGIKDLVGELEDAVEPLRDIARTSLSTRPWYEKLNVSVQQHLGTLGRSMLQLTIKYTTEPGNREETMKMAREIGGDFGQTLALAGLPLTDAVEAFIMHRDPIMNTASRLMKRREALRERVIEAIPLMPHVMDEALVALVAAHQLYRNGTHSGAGKEQTA